MNANNQAEKILFDTDIGCDCDDAGALAVLHALEKNGEAEILAVTSCTPSLYAPGCIDAINRYFGRGDIPVGMLRDDPYESPCWRDVYAQAIAGNFPNRFASESCPDAVKLMRKVLAEQDDQDVTIVATGCMRNLMLLLKSAPDEYSDLNGIHLVYQKVKRTVIMGGYFSGKEQDLYLDNKVLEAEFNIIADIEGAQYVCNHWPGELIFSPYEIGNFIITGKNLVLHGSGENPVRKCYEVHCGGERNSWDHTAILYAVRPESGYWDLHGYGHIHIDSSGVTEWWPRTDGKQTYLLEKASREELSKIIDDLMQFEPKLVRV